ncbi:MAG: aminopeptidase P N-terminal domain-containing protein [Longimicrobiales bacterium]
MAERILGFSKETFEARRDRVLDRIGDGSMILSAAPLRYRSRDTEHRYRPDSELFYLTGSTQPGVVAVLQGGEEEDRFLLFVPPRDLKAEVWSGPRLGPEAAREYFRADAAYSTGELDERLPDLLRKPHRVLFRLGSDPILESLVVEALRTARRKGARKGEGPRIVEDPGQVLDELRVRKDPEEVARIRHAAGLTVEAFQVAMRGTRPGMGEWEVESLLEGSFRRGGARGPAFPTIVGSGGNACTLHYSANEHTIDGGELVLLDGGAEVDLYAGDVTRTFPAGGRFSGEQRAVYDVVLSAHQAALGTVRPGNTVAQLHDAAVAALTEGLVDLGVLTGGVDDLVREKAYEPYFPHQTSHWLGLDVHDVGDYARQGSPRVLEEGMVLTVEPGLYFPALGEESAGPFAGIGIRIEDDVLVTADGSENLTEALPVSAAEVETLSGG